MRASLHPSFDRDVVGRDHFGSDRDVPELKQLRIRRSGDPNEDDTRRPHGAQHRPRVARHRHAGHFVGRRNRDGARSVRTGSTRIKDLERVILERNGTRRAVQRSHQQARDAMLLGERRDHQQVDHAREYLRRRSTLQRRLRLGGGRSEFRPQGARGDGYRRRRRGRGVGSREAAHAQRPTTMPPTITPVTNEALSECGTFTKNVPALRVL